MLTELRIENFAIIDKLVLEFGQGLITFTGETGAGKSILIDAVETLLGGRADTSQVRSDTKCAIIEGVFRVPPAGLNQIHSILKEQDLLDDTEHLILTREIYRDRRNIARVNGYSVNVSLLRKLGRYLIDVHGQSKHLSLLRVSQHLDLLDNFAETEDTLTEYRQNYQDLLSIRNQLTSLRASEKDSARHLDLLNYQINEIKAANLQEGEEVELKQELKRLANAEELTSLVQETLLALDESTPETQAATDLIGQAVEALDNLSQLDTSQTAKHEQAQTVFDNITDLSLSLRSYLEDIEYNPKRLNQVEERLSLIHNLKRKYGSSISSILGFAGNIQQEIDLVSSASERIIQLEKDEEKTLKSLAISGETLSEKRHTKATILEESVESELNDLQMAGTQFKVEFTREPDPEGVTLRNGQKVSFNSTGIERIEFFIAPNPGEGFKPLVKIASGGETSRLMLALKNVLTAADNIFTLIFDEIDQGIGGRVGSVVGKKMWTLAHQHQVLCVTHLPQLAAFGDQHFQIHKQVHKGRTTTEANILDRETRINELAQMFGDINESTLQSAQKLLRITQESKTE